MSAAAATDTAPKSNPSFLEKEMKQKQQQGRAMCLLPGPPAAVTTEMFGPFQSSNSIPFAPFFCTFCKLLCSSFDALSSLLQLGKQPQTFLQNGTVSLFPFLQMLLLNQFSFVSSFFYKIDICMPFLGTFSVPADGFRPGQGTSSRPGRASVHFPPASVYPRSNLNLQMWDSSALLPVWSPKLWIFYWLVELWHQHWPRQTSQRQKIPLLSAVLVLKVLYKLLHALTKPQKSTTIS